MATPAQQTDANYKPGLQYYDPVGGQFVWPQAGLVYTAADGTKYAAGPDAPVDGFKSSYGASVQGLVPAASATDIFTITGSATKTIRITRIEVSGTQTTAGQVDVIVLKRSTADTGGTSTAPTLVPHDKSNAAATAVVNAYTANPAVGTLVGNLRAGKLFVAAPATASPTTIMAMDFGPRPAQALVLRGVTDVIAINLNGSTVTGGSFNIGIEFTEE